MSGDKFLNNVEFQEDSSTIVTSTMFKLKNPGEYSEKYHYSRYGYPTRDLLESSLASLDNANYAVTYCSGTAAAMASLSILKSGETVIFNDFLSCEKFKNLFPQLHMITIDFADLKNFEQSLQPNAKMVFIESSTNLFQTILDIKFIADFIHSKSEAILVVDNTLLTSYLQKPLNLGADIVVYSLNEYIGGHDDVNMGAVATNDKKYYEKLRYYQVSAGACCSPIDCFIINRSLKTFSVRMERHSKNAIVVEKFLKSHEKVDEVFKASVKDNKTESDEICANSGIVGFKIKENFKNQHKFMSNLKVVKISKSFGGTESSISHPWSMSHAGLTEQKRLELGMTETFMKLSIGLEKPEEIIDDLNQALDQLS